MFVISREYVPGLLSADFYEHGAEGRGAHPQRPTDDHTAKNIGNVMFTNDPEKAMLFAHREEAEGAARMVRCLTLCDMSTVREVKVRIDKAAARIHVS